MRSAPRWALSARAPSICCTAGRLRPRLNDGLEIIIKQIDRISGIVRMLLDYARAREPVRDRRDVRPIVEHALSLVETEATRRQVHLTAELGERPLLVECDADQLQQVFINLAINALDAMAPDGGTLRVAAEVSGIDHERRARITFEDTGPGVPPKFARACSTRSSPPRTRARGPGWGWRSASRSCATTAAR